jgi:hypothetical protein
MKSHLSCSATGEGDPHPEGAVAIDAFLPSAEAMPTQFPDPRLRRPVQSREAGRLEEWEEARRQRRRVPRRATCPAAVQPIAGR